VEPQRLAGGRAERRGYGLDLHSRRPALAGRSAGMADQADARRAGVDNEGVGLGGAFSAAASESHRLVQQSPQHDVTDQRPKLTRRRPHLSPLDAIGADDAHPALDGEQTATPSGVKKFIAGLPRTPDAVWSDGTQFDFYDNPDRVRFASDRAIAHFRKILA
jgi:hypothetical protein